MASISRALSPWANTPTSPPMQMITPEARAARKFFLFAVILAGSGPIPFCPHRRKDLRRAVIPVLDGRHAGLDGPFHPFYRGRVNDDLPATAASDFHGQLQFLQGESRGRLVIQAPAIVGIYLDQVGAIADL